MLPWERFKRLDIVGKLFMGLFKPYKPICWTMTLTSRMANPGSARGTEASLTVSLASPIAGLSYTPQAPGGISLAAFATFDQV